MKTLDLGRIEANALLVFGGPYGNLEATEALLAHAQDLGIPAEHMICTGDLAAYCADPVATSHTLRRAGIPVIQGNCEQSLAAGADDCGCGFDSGSQCAALSRSWFDFCQRQIDSDTLSWFNELPQQLSFQFGGQRFLVVHGSPNTMSRFVFGSSSADYFKAAIESAKVDCVIGGHSGLPFTRVFDTCCWHNSGVLGMPANDGTARVWYSLIKTGDSGITFEHRALHYAAEVAQQKMHAAGLSAEYAESLTSGLWPSLDVLPAYEASQAGIRLREHPVQWPL
ncbi:metallophosphoesterase family protein [Coraliomargarita sp. SDUM461003]|uniref:Metallophosphoesterase family protein n=1 Tax=Thalassobacterium maritimum TaxID=3041265 RepID=A0ABU1ARS4_9BACT|nr:metallophosphoesterase family protein [Coraliomargarita sp. SDUM461003]MDQ8206861.1 metallophosphoesterase family protein [Coraliomargarita sp. SDUM461003]